MQLTPEDKEVGRGNFRRVLSAFNRSDNEAAINRRDFLMGSVGAGGMLTAGAGAMYFGYGQSVPEPVRVGMIGVGDEGNVLIGAMNPDYVTVTAICDIRYSSQHRAFYGDYASTNAKKVRPGLIQVYDLPEDRAEAEKTITVHERYQDLLADSSIEAVIIAVPLHLHHEIAMAAMQAGKHVLTEKLMAHNITQCKEMSRLSKETNLYLATGHQRHYNILYEEAVNLLRWGVFGEIHHIRAQWHRNNLPGNDTWQPPLPFDVTAQMDDPQGNFAKGDSVNVVQRKLDALANKLKGLEKKMADGKLVNQETVVLLRRQVPQWKQWMLDATINAENFGYQSRTLSDGYECSALEELLRWRLWNRTSGGLMAELGSHQLDAASIFISALRRDGKKAHPLTVHAVGGRHIFPHNRDCDDHVYCSYEFPGPGYDKDFKPGYNDPFYPAPDPATGIPGYEEDKDNKKIVVTYSSINGNGFGGHGEIVMGTKGTFVLEKEADLMIFKNSDKSASVSVSEGSGGPTLDTTESGAPTVAATATTGPVSRGYREQIEHWAWCIRNQDRENQPRCHPEIAVADAVIALTSNLAMDRANRGLGGYVEFKEEWFDIDSDATPEEDLK